MIYLSRRTQKKADLSQGWPSTSGTIIDVQVVRNYSAGGDDDISAMTYSPKLRYSYKVNDVEYTSDKIAFGYGKQFSTEMAALSSIQRYPKGGLVTVYYNPENQNEAVLERNAGRQIWGVVGGILLIVFGLCPACAMIGTGIFLGTGG